jgi:hypothetical protein
MLYKFKSRETADVIMLEPNARTLLQIIGKTDQGEAARKGILLPDAMPQAMAAIEAAVRADEELRRAIREGQKEHASGMDPVSLRQRAQPLLAMISRCHMAEREIVWGV